MEIKAAQLIPRGMNQDLSISKFNPELSYENKNIRITPRDNNSFLSIETERGNSLVATSISIEGICIGYAVLNNYLILFTTQPGATSPDRIYRIKDLVTTILLFNGNLGFNINNPIETLPYFETDAVQKVYWVDGINQTRVINFMATSETIASWSNDSFNFAPTMALNETVEVIQKPTGGAFASGMIQYGFTYFNAHSPQTNLFHVTDLFSTSSADRALSAEEISPVSFKITLSNLDANFEYVRVYSIHRSSWNTLPSVKIIGDFLKPSDDTSMIIYDNGDMGYDTSLDVLLYLGGEDVILGSITSKDNVFFGANIKLNRDISILEDLKTLKNPDGTYSGISLNWVNRTTPLILEDKDSAINPSYYYLPYSLPLSSGQTTHFKNGQYYRIGFQAQHQTGKWSEPIYIGQDYKCDRQYITMLEETATTGKVKLFLNKGELTLPSAVLKVLYDNGYKKVRPIMAIPSLSDRQILAQGIVTNTLAWDTQRQKNAPFSIVDYMARPSIFDRDALASTFVENAGIIPTDELGLANFTHLMPLVSEVQGTRWDGEIVKELPGEDEKPAFFIDQNMLNLWSPDLEYGNSLDPYLTGDLSLKIIGLANVTTSTVSSYYEDSDGNTGQISGKLYNTAYVTDATINKNSGAQMLVNLDVPNVPGYIWPYNLKKVGYTDSNTVIEPITLKKKHYALKTYALYNTFFTPSITNLTYPINKPALLNTNDSYKVIPYRTNKSDFNGSIIYAKHYDDLIYSPQSVYDPDTQTTAIKTLNTRFAYNSNTHLLFSLKDYYENNGYKTRVLPSLLWNESANTPTTVVQVDVKVASQSAAPTEEPNEYDIEIKYEIRISNITEMPDDDSIILGCKVWLYPSPVPAGPTQDLTMPDGGFYDLSAGDPPTLLHTFTKSEYLNQLAGSGLTYYTVDFTDTIVSTAEGTPFNSTNINTNIVIDSEDISKYTITGESAPVNFTNIEYPTPTWRVDQTPVVKYYKEYMNVRTMLYNTGNPNMVNSGKGLPYFLIGEIIKPVDLTTLYGGNTVEALENNLWIPCGPANKITKADEVYSVPTLQLTEGDTYVRRYDCLRIFPDNEELVNKVTNVASFLCESYINMDGRYDRNRFNPDVSTSRLSNFGLMNMVYSQPNNIFNYRILDENMFLSKEFNNQVTWTLEKMNGELVDSWANLTMLSTIDLDGSLGPINAIKTFNNEIVTFQDKGIARILFNSRVMVQTSDDTPIELANNGKVSGFRYITNQMGCKNKWSIKETKSGLYFIDSLNKSINSYTGESISDVSLTKGFKAWGYNNLNESNILFNIPNGTHNVNLNNFVTSYNRLQGEVYFTNKDLSLGYSEMLESFPSFYSYENTPYMFNVLDNFIALKSVYDTGTSKYISKLYKQNNGNYSSFFGTLQSSYIHYLVNPDPMLDKVFNNLDFRADGFDMDSNGAHLPNKTFTSIRAWNEYQDTNTVAFTVNSNIFKKFRIWRCAIPRSTGTINRIRNPWTNLKLTFTPSINENVKLVMHDLIVKYTI